MYGQSLNLYTRTLMFLWFTQVEIDWKDTRDTWEILLVQGVYTCQTWMIKQLYSALIVRMYYKHTALIPHQVTAKIVAAMNGHEAVLQIWKERLVISWTMRLFRALRLNSHGWSRWPTGSKAEDLACGFQGACLDGKVALMKSCAVFWDREMEGHHLRPRIGILEDCLLCEVLRVFQRKTHCCSFFGTPRFNRTDSVSDAMEVAKLQMPFSWPLVKYL